MRRAVLFAAGLALGWALAGTTARAQVRVERDAQGKIVITNKGSKAAERLAGSPSAPPLPALSAGLRKEIQAKLRKACAERGLDYDLVAALVEAESDFRPNVLSKKGAVGLMQLMPDTAKRFGCADPWDLDQNIQGGTAFLAFLHERFEGDIPLILAGYNAGEDAVRKYGNRIPPYAETVRYVFSILHNYGRPAVTERARGLLASPGDYDRFYTPRKGQKPVLRLFYMFVDEKGVRHIYDYPPSGVVSTPIVYKDE
ncbi:MAG: lytic transglycosylase domain-containing protein [Acidobacteriota bacterium]